MRHQKNFVSKKNKLHCLGWLSGFLSCVTSRDPSSNPTSDIVLGLGFQSLPDHAGFSQKEFSSHILQRKFHGSHSSWTLFVLIMLLNV